MAEDKNIRVIGLLRKDDKILLGEKTEGIGQGNFVAIGGKQEKGETLEQTLQRELMEEIDVEVLSYEKVAEIRFEFEQKVNWNQTVAVFVCNKWTGKPKATSEMKPKWFSPNKMPYTNMWEDAYHWYPFILSGRKIKAYFKYDADNKTLTQASIEEVK